MKKAVLNTSHSSFPQPDDIDAPIWRYVSFPKLVHLLTTSTLYFSRIDTLPDARECTMPDKFKRDMHDYWVAKLKSESMDYIDPHEIVGDQKSIRMASYINCWCQRSSRVPSFDPKGKGGLRITQEPPSPCGMKEGTGFA